MPSRLILALALSLALHAGLLAPAAFWRRTPTPPPALQATLRLPLKPAALSDDPVFKDTLATAEAPAVAKPPPPPPPRPNASRDTPPQRPAKAAARRDVEAAQRKLSEHIYYPPEAVERGLEGEVRLLLMVADDGRITAVSVGLSSGHAILDKAAVKAAWSMGKLSWAHSRELILPVVFRLE
ncbi:energy transducer TonB [Candidatus Accumulibacter sp. ACC003]|uniref:energy transducer TonB n=1 Tax=Candidatus Accumulibacter sp. ACC003 TaxID=2823334 RepID=UPI0025C1B288|nr:energy transducer TonB [Candidatus Accumulibacter sp. ACC003]